MPSKRITVDSEVFQRLTAPQFVGKTPNQMLRFTFGLPETKTYRPRRKRNWLSEAIRKFFK